MRLPSRLGEVHISLALFFVAIVGQAARVQLINGVAWQERADRQQVRERDIPAPRGQIRANARRRSALICPFAAGQGLAPKVPGNAKDPGPRTGVKRGDGGI